MNKIFIIVRYFKKILVLKKHRRDGRVVEGARLESVYTVTLIFGQYQF
jgi:hypothetical protein